MCESVSVLGVAVPLKHAREGPQAVAVCGVASPSGWPAVALCPWRIKTLNHGTDLALPLDFRGQDRVRLCPEEPLLRDGKGHYRTTEPQGQSGFISDGCPVPLGMGGLPSGDRDAQVWG